MWRSQNRKRLPDLGDIIAKLGFPGGLDGKESACNVGDLDSIPGLGRSPGEATHSNILVWRVLAEELAGYSPWGFKELDMTEQLSLSCSPRNMVKNIHSSFYS